MVPGVLERDAGWEVTPIAGAHEVSERACPSDEIVAVVAGGEVVVEFNEGAVAHRYRSRSTTEASVVAGLAGTTLRTTRA